MEHPENDELLQHPLGYGIDPHQPHDQYDHLLD
jgi:hypothetical protein